MVKIKKLSKDEINEIAENYAKIMKKFFIQVKEKPITAKEYAITLRKNYRKSFMIVLESKKILGFVWFTKKNKEFFLDGIFVTEHGKGYGGLLMRHLIKEARKKGIKKINLNVHKPNKKAIKFFKKFGFTERTIEMSKDLK